MVSYVLRSDRRNQPKGNSMYTNETAIRSRYVEIESRQEKEGGREGWS